MWLSVDPNAAWLRAIAGQTAAARCTLRRGRLLMQLDLGAEAPIALELISSRERARLRAAPGRPAAAEAARRADRLTPEHAAELAHFARRARWLLAVLSGEGPAGDYLPSSEEQQLLQAAAALNSIRAVRDVCRARDRLPAILSAKYPEIELLLAFIEGRWPEIFAEGAFEGARGLRPLLLAFQDVPRFVDRDAPALVEAELAPLIGLALKKAGQLEAAIGFLELGAGAVDRSACAELRAQMMDCLHVLGRDAEATALGRSAILLDEENDDLLTRVAARLARGGAIADAVACLARRCDREPPCLPALLQLAELHLWGGEVARADALLSRADQLSPGSATVERLRGISLALSGAQDAAIEHFLAARGLEPSDRESATWLAELHLRRGDLDAAQRWLDEARAAAQNPAHIILQAVLGRPGGAQHDRELLALLRHLGEELRPEDWAEPEAARQSALRLLAGFGGSRGEVLVRRLKQRGASSEPGELGVVRAPADDESLASREAAADALRRIVELAPEAVLQQLDELSERFAASPHPLCYRGELCLWLGRYDEALRCFDEALERRPARWAYVGKAAVAVLTGDQQAALSHIAECRARFEDVPGATTLVYLGESYRLVGEHARARELLSEAVRVKPGRVAAWINLALVAEQMGDVEAADALGERVERSVPRLLWTASKAISVAEWPVLPAHRSAVYQQALVMMRGNRSSHTITYFDGQGRLRVARDALAWRELLAKNAHYAARFLLSRLRSLAGGGPVTSPGPR